MSSNITPLVSILTPCYNCEKYIERYFKSILDQTYSNIELIIINDGSKDRTEEIVLSYKSKFEEKAMKLIYLYQENKGLGGAINTGLKKITGEYFTWCDSDNFYTNDYIDTKVNFFSEHKQYSIVRCDGYIVMDTNISKPTAYLDNRKNDRHNEKLFSNAIEERDFHFGCAMLKTEDFDKVNPTRDIYESREGQNWQLLLPMFYYFKSGYIDKPMFYFVYRSDSVSNITSNKGIQEKLAQQEEYKKILTTVIMEMKIPEERYYIEVIQRKYAKRKLNISYQFKNEALLEEQYQILKENDWLDEADKEIYMRGKYIALDFVYKIFVLPIKVFRKIKKMIRQWVK